MSKRAWWFKIAMRMKTNSVIDHLRQEDEPA